MKPYLQLYNFGNNWVMKLVQPDLGIMIYNSQTPTFDVYIQYCIADLATNSAVKRTSYDTWQWDNEDQAYEFITFFTLKY